MSEKLYKVIEAVDLFSESNLIPERYLVFIDSEGHQTKEFFLRDRITLFFQGKLYDWYGREVKVPDDVSILKPLGYRDDHSLWSSTQEKFLASTPDHRLAFAWISDSDELPVDPNSPMYYKHRLLHARLSYAPSLKLEKWSFQKIVDLQSTCFNHFKHAEEYLALSGVSGADLSSKNRPSLKNFLSPAEKRFDYPSIWFTRGPTHDQLLEHRILKTRDEILSYSPYVRKWSNNDPCAAHVQANYLLGDLKFSKHGEKMTAKAPVPDEHGNTCISTDSEVIKHSANFSSHLIWYYDPEP